MSHTFTKLSSYASQTKKNTNSRDVTFWKIIELLFRTSGSVNDNIYKEKKI